MKTLIIPDVHQRVSNVLLALNEETWDRAVFLGDWFDSFYEPPLVAGFEATCLFLRELLTSHPRREDMTFLLGNHDINYIFNNTGARGARHVKKLHYYASGYTQNKCAHFRKTFYEAGLRDSFFIENFKVAHYEQGWLLSHAGFIPECLPYGRTIEWYVETLLPEVWENFRHTEYPRNESLSAVGVARGGNYSFGGPLWLDWNDEFYADPRTGKQIVGHTTVEMPRAQSYYSDPEGSFKHEGDRIVRLKEPDFRSWNLDTCIHYGILLDGELYYKKYTDLVRESPGYTPGPGTKAGS